jgi:hypothetical protein
MNLTFLSIEKKLIVNTIKTKQKATTNNHNAAHQLKSLQAAGYEHLILYTLKHRTCPSYCTDVNILYQVCCDDTMPLMQG